MIGIKIELFSLFALRIIKFNFTNRVAHCFDCYFLIREKNIDIE